MRSRALFVFVSSLACARAQDPYAPLRLYEGSWEMTLGGKRADTLTNRCALLERFFVCEQIVNGKSAALITFLPTETAGHYWTNALSSDARSNGRGDLAVVGSRWVYSSQSTDGNGKTTHYRTVNLFTGKDRIHFEAAESADGEKWVITNSGDETRAASRLASPAK